MKKNKVICFLFSFIGSSKSFPPSPFALFFVVYYIVLLNAVCNKINTYFFPIQIGRSLSYFNWGGCVFLLLSLSILFYFIYTVIFQYDDLITQVKAFSIPTHPSLLISFLHFSSLNYLHS